MPDLDDAALDAARVATAVLDIHKRDTYLGHDCCSTCLDGHPGVGARPAPWPCATVRALATPNTSETT